MATDNTEVSEEFAKVVGDFINDITRTFPEYNPFVKKWWKTMDDFKWTNETSEEKKEIYNSRKKKDILFLYKFCSKKYPSKFFQILNQDDSIFSDDSEVDTEFLPFIHFKNLWQDDISNDTRSTIWKYLQIILFSVVGSVKDKETFGETAKLFEDMDENVFKEKLDNALDEIKGIFENRNTQDDESGEQEGFTSGPNADDIHSHLSGMFSGKLGNLAREIAEETAGELDMDMEGATDVKDVFNKMFKNPGKLMGLVQNVGNKLEEKMKSGDISQTELMQEASEMMNNMKNIPGMGDMQSMLNKLGVNMGGGAKMDFKGMQNKMNQEMKRAQAREHAQKVAAKKRAQKEAAAQQVVHEQPKYTDEELVDMMKDLTKDEPVVEKKKKSKKKKKAAT